MAGEQRVIWDEGMMLAPQHFQQWDRWIAAELRDRSRACTTFAWGFTQWELDQDALAGGQVALRQCSGLLADGTSFRCPDRDPLPAARSAVDRMGADQQSVTVHLALPSPATGASAYGEGTDAATFTRSRQSVQDEARPETDREIATARLNLGLRFEGESLDGYRVMPIARLVRAEGGGVAVADDFMAPALVLQAAPLATGVLRKVIGMLTQKWTELAGRRRGGGMAEATGFLLLHTVGGSLPALRHCLAHGQVSTETAYLHLARLTAQLCTFQGDTSATDVPEYSHDDPGPCFRKLSTMLQSLLGEAAPTRCIELALERAGESLFTAKIPSPDMLTAGRLYLAVKAEAPETEVQSRFPSMVKISSIDRIQDLLVRAVPGLSLRVVQQPPQAIPIQTGRSYFVLEPRGEHWDAISASQTVGFHVAPGLTELRMELLAVRE